MSKAFKRRNNIRFLFAIIFVCSIICMLLFSTPILRVKTISIEGSEYYSDQKIMDQARISVGMHLLQLNKRRSVKEISTLPYIELVQIDRVFPNTLKLTITQRKPIGYVPFSGTYLSIDKTGQVIDQSHSQEVHNLPIIEGLKFDKFVLGEQLEVENEDIIMAVIEITTLIEKYDLLGRGIKIDVGNPNKIHLYINSLDVIIGEINNLDKKIQWLCEIIEQYQMGVLDLSNINKGQAIMSPLT